MTKNTGEQQVTSHISAAALDRTKQTIHAAELFYGQARSIAAACAEAGRGELVVVAVSPDMAFRGIWTIPRAQLSDHVSGLDDGGWSMTFSPGLSVAAIEERCIRLARISFARWEAMMRWSSRNT